MVDGIAIERRVVVSNLKYHLLLAKDGIDVFFLFFDVINVFGIIYHLVSHLVDGITHSDA